MAILSENRISASKGLRVIPILNFPQQSSANYNFSFSFSFLWKLINVSYIKLCENEETALICAAFLRFLETYHSPIIEMSWQRQHSFQLHELAINNATSGAEKSI